MPSMQQLVLDALARRGEGWRLPSHAADRLVTRLEELARRAPDVVAATRPVLKLVVALRAEPASAAAADAIVVVLRRSPTIYAALRSRRIGAGSRGRRDAARLSAFEGRRGPVKAPLHDAPSPQGTLPARHLMRPLDPAAAKAKRR